MRFVVLLLLAMASLSAAHAADAEKPYGQWLESFKKDAAAAGITAQTLNEAFAKTEAPLDEVIDLDRKQPESQITFSEYLENIVSQSRIDNGLGEMNEYNDLLNAVAQRYGVQKEFILALWGIETSYGENTGNFNVIDSLATLAYDGRRSDYFRGELINVLKIMQSEHMPADTMQGSWAGALGQCQFMPTTYLEYAVDFDGDGHRNIWDDQGDVFASIANYLHSLGWDDSIGWGIEVSLPAGFNMSLVSIDQARSLSEWAGAGVKWQGDAVSKEKFSGGTQLSLVDVGKADDVHYYLVSSNYKAILKWNRSRYFATAIGTLSDGIR